MHKDWQPLGFVSNWGGMEIGDQMMYRVSCVDGLVQELGGLTLRAEIQLRGTVCPVGKAVKTTAGKGQLSRNYQKILHTSPPFYRDENSCALLEQCYQSVLKLIESDNEFERVAFPLLGAGVRGFPSNMATKIAAQACVPWCHEVSEGRCKSVVFGLVDHELADEFVLVLKEEYDKMEKAQ
jgi:O-acetyl-ADP-ribose deacetylase (regulator of RNase III)